MMQYAKRWLVVVVVLPVSCNEGPPTQASPATQDDAGPAAATTQATAGRTAQDRLLGTWVAHDVETKMGDVKIKLTFREEGRMKLAAWSDIPFVGQVRDKTAPYEVHRNVISSEAIRGGTSVEYSFEQDELIIKYKEGKTVRFTRQ